MAQWDAFISYARSASTLEAQKLQTAIQTFAKPWHRLRAVRIFRDDSSMSANPGLWSTIEQGLREARWLVVLLSPAAARSEYVAAEIRWWLQHKDASSILLVHDEGTLAWDRVRNDFSAATDCVPAPLRGAFREEPRWSDLSWFDAPGSSGAADPRFKEKVADLAAAIRGVPRDELLGEDVAQHRRSWRLAKLAIAGLSLLLVASIAAGIIAVVQRNEVVRQANALLARQLAVTADSLLGRDLRRAQLLAVQAYRTDPTPETRAALLRASLASPALRRFVPFAAGITALSASADGRFVVAGLENGEVFSLDVAAATPQHRLTLPAAVNDVGVSDDGTVVAAVASGGIQLTTAAGVGALVLPSGQQPGHVAVSPSGRSVVIASKGDRPFITLADLAGRSQRTVPDPIDPEGYGAFGVQFVGEDRLLVIGGTIEVRSFPAFTRISRGDFFYGSRQRAGRVSADGRYTTATNGRNDVPVWRTDGNQERPERSAYLPMTNETASALNHDGRLLAVADAAGVHLASVRDTNASVGNGNSVPTPTTFVGISQVNPQGVLFLGTTSRFAVAAGAELSLWDPDSAGRSATTAGVPIPSSCTACGSPAVVLSPDGQSMAIRDGDRTGLLVGNVPGRSGALVARTDDGLNAGELTLPVWLDAASLLQVTAGSTTGTLRGPIPGLPEGILGWAVGRENSRIVAIRLAADAQSVLLVDATGRITRHQARTGVLISETRAAVDDEVFDAAISDDLATVALVPQDLGPLRVVDAATGAERFRVGAQSESVVRALFASGSLWVRYPNGLIERRDPSTGDLQRRLPGRFPGSWPLTEASGLVSIPTDLSVSLYHAAADALIGSVAAPQGWASTRRGVGLSADGSVLVLAFETRGDDASGGGLAVGYQLDPERLVGQACRTAGGSLNPDDWRALVGGEAPADLSCR